ncbi:MAG: SMC-Scp complex subunit ScpB [bacterium]
MASLLPKLQAALLVSIKPVSTRKLAEVVAAEPSAVRETLLAWQEELKGSGFALLHSGDSWQLGSSSDQTKVTEQLVNEDLSGELTRPSLEALTIIAYRGPVTKSELEKIRGVNCSMILRNLQIRGLVEEIADDKGLEPCYQATVEFLKYLGIDNTKRLPDYEKLNKDVNLETIVTQTDQQSNG